MEKEYNASASVQNKYGEWVPAIPEPFHGFFRVKCWQGKCNATFKTEEQYRGHYALNHIMGLV